MGTPIDDLFEKLRYAWVGGEMGDTARQLIASMTPALEADVLAALVEEGDAYPADGVMASGSILSFYQNRGFRFHGLVDVVAKRRALAGVPVLRTLLLHSSDQVRTSVERALVEIGDPASLVEIGARVGASMDPTAINTWLQIQLRAEPAAAYTAITDRIARAKTEEDAKAIRDSALHAIATAPNLDPRWADVAAEHLASWWAINVLVRLRDRRAIPTLVKDLDNPGYSTVQGALERLKVIVNTDELLAIATPFYEHAYYPEAFEQVLGSAMASLTARRQEKRQAALRAQSHPFLFFGAAPGDWYEGANMGYGYLIRFAVLDDTRRAQVQGIFEFHRRRRLDVDTGSLQWGDLDDATWLELRVGGDPFALMRTALVGVHTHVPIREVIFMNQREESRDDDWTAWSHLQNAAAKRVPLLRPNLALDRIYYFAGREGVAVTSTPTPAKPATKAAAKKPAAKKPAAKKPAAKKPAAKKPAKKKPAAKKR